MTTPRTPHTPWAHVARLGVALAAIVTVVVIAFLWPSVTASAHGLPIAITGPGAQVSAVEAAITKASPDTFAFTTVSDRAAAVKRIEQRKDYGAIVLGAVPEVLTSSAANPTVAQLLDTTLAPSLHATTKDVVPLASTDPRGSTIGAASFPMVLGGILGGALIAVVIVGVWRRVIALGIYAVIGSAAITGVLQGWFGGLQGNYFFNAGAIALVLLGIGGTMLGLAALVGRAGIVIGPVLFLLGANPISAAAIPVEFIAAPWGAVGQWFPPGAGSTLLRELSYFPKADLAFPWLVITGWAVLGLALSLIGHLRNSGAASRAAEAEAGEASN